MSLEVFEIPPGLGLYYCGADGMDHTRDKLDRLGKAFDDMAEGLAKMHAENEQAENKLKKIANEWQATFDSITDHVMILDNKFKIVRGNRAVASFFNLPVDSLIGKSCFSLMHGTDRPLDTCPLKKMFGTGQHEEVEVYCGSQGKWLLMSADPITDAAGTITGAVHIIKNINDRKLSEEAINNEKLRFQTLVDNAPFGMILTDKNGHAITYVNPYFKKFFGYEMADLPDLESWFLKAYPDPAYRERVIASWEKDLKEAAPGIQSQRAYTIVCRDGSPREVHFSTVLFSSGEILLCGEDVTDRRNLEEELILSRKMEAIGTLAGGIAHDFNNILMAILGYTSIILVDTDINDPNYEKLKIIEEQVQSGADLTKQLLGFARAGKYEIKTIDLNELLAGSAEMFGRTKKEIHIYRKHERDLWTVEADRVQIEQVFLNLFVNAWQAMPAGGELYIETQNVILDDIHFTISSLKPGKYVMVSITDTGEGIDETLKERIFEPFFTTIKMGRGTGLGLASAYGVIKNHGGTIRVYSGKGKGTTFKVYLPASEKELIDEKFTSDKVIKGTETILFVDDQVAVTNVGKNMLQALGYVVRTAKSGKEAIGIYKKNKETIDLVILDMIMPVMSGGETYRALKNINPRIKVILSSGYSMNGEAAKILESGCNGFIQKPFNVMNLSKKIREVLG